VGQDCKIVRLQLIPLCLAFSDKLLPAGLAVKWSLDPEYKELGGCLSSLGVCMPMSAHVFGPEKKPCAIPCFLCHMQSCWGISLQKTINYILQDSSVIQLCIYLHPTATGWSWPRYNLCNSSHVVPSLWYSLIGHQHHLQC